MDTIKRLILFPTRRPPRPLLPTPNTTTTRSRVPWDKVLLHILILTGVSLFLACVIFVSAMLAIWAMYDMHFVLPQDMENARLMARISAMLAEARKAG
jgi:hypothetical protein